MAPKAETKNRSGRGQPGEEGDGNLAADDGHKRSVGQATRVGGRAGEAEGARSERQRAARRGGAKPETVEGRLVNEDHQEKARGKHAKEGVREGQRTPQGHTKSGGKQREGKRGPDQPSEEPAIHSPTGSNQRGQADGGGGGARENSRRESLRNRKKGRTKRETTLEKRPQNRQRE